MKTNIIHICPDEIVVDQIDEIVDVLRKDGIIVYPTETYYGLGANGFSAKAVQKVYRLKKRDALKPLPVMISDIAMLERLVSEIPPMFRPLISEFWPGPLTVILKASPEVPEGLQGNGTIGLRLPGYEWVRSLVSRAQFPITATSANVSGEKEISDPEKARESYHGKVKLIVDGGITQGTLPSTVVDMSGEEPRLVREGAISSSQLKIFLPAMTGPQS